MKGKIVKRKVHGWVGLIKNDFPEYRGKAPVYKLVEKEDGSYEETKERVLVDFDNLDLIGFQD